VLVILSDLHFVDESAGKHNLPFEAFESVLLTNLAAIVNDSKKEIREVILLFLGDTFDLISTQKWFDEEFKDRPWGSNGLSDVININNSGATEKRCLRILGQLGHRTKPQRQGPSILEKNYNTFKLFREFGENLSRKSKKDLKVKLLYIPGNHDRLVNVYPSLRHEVSKILGLTTGGDQPFENSYENQSYGVFASHGHEHDRLNFHGKGLTQKDYMEVPVGDVLTTEFIVKVPWKVAAELDMVLPRIEEDEKKILIRKLQDVDNVRPMHKVLKFINYRANEVGADHISMVIEDSVRQALEELLKIDSGPMRSRNPFCRTAKFVLSWLLHMCPSLFHCLMRNGLISMFLEILARDSDPKNDGLAIGACKVAQSKLATDIYAVAYGHTHVPVQTPIAVFGNKEIFYINTGTWRPLMTQTLCAHKGYGFVEGKNLTYAIFYNREEDLRDKQKRTRSFELWTGFKKKHYVMHGLDSKPRIE
jgi:UDP-2,3-diacylglucosamine pyrophosphatase LpxH